VRKTKKGGAGLPGLRQRISKKSKASACEVSPRLPGDFFRINCDFLCNLLQLDIAMTLEHNPRSS
jgi:hypothetical protein